MEAESAKRREKLQCLLLLKVKHINASAINHLMAIESTIDEKHVFGWHSLNGKILSMLRLSCLFTALTWTVLISHRPQESMKAAAKAILM